MTKYKSGMISIEMIGIIAILGAIIAFSAYLGIDFRQSQAAASLVSTLNISYKAAQAFLDAEGKDLAVNLKTPSDTTSDTVDTTDPATSYKYIRVLFNDIEGCNGTCVSLRKNPTDKIGLSKYMGVNKNLTRFNQEIQFFLYKDSAGQVQGFLATKLPNVLTAKEFKDYQQIANKVVKFGSFGSLLKDDGGKLEFVGEADSWRFPLEDAERTLDLTDFYDDKSIGELGRPVMGTNAVAEVAPFLYRISIDGNPKLNQMQTDLSMGTHEIKDAGAITINPAEDPSTDTTTLADQKCKDSKNVDGYIFTLKGEKDTNSNTDDGGIYVCMDGKARLVSDTANSMSLKNTQIFADGDTVSKPKCPVGTKPLIFVSPVTVADNMNPSPVAALQAYAEEMTGVDADKWKVHVRMKTTVYDNAWFHPANCELIPTGETHIDAKALNRLMVMTICSRFQDTSASAE